MTYQEIATCVAVAAGVGLMIFQYLFARSKEQEQMQAREDLMNAASKKNNDVLKLRKM